jgi:alpha-2-macroglobulin
VAGRSRFRTPELLVFEPQALKPAQRYLVRVSASPAAHPSLRELLNAHPLSWTFETPGPAVTDSYPFIGIEANRWTKWQPALLKLSQPVTAAALRKLLSVHTTGNPELSIAVRVEAISRAVVRRWDWASDLVEGDEPLGGRLFQVLPLKGWPVDREIAVEVAPGLVGRLGPVASASLWRTTWKTPGPLRVESVTTDDAFCASPSIVLQLSSPIPTSQLAKIRVSPRPPNTTVTFDDYTDDAAQSAPRSGAEIRIRGRFVLERPYAVELAPTIRDVFGYTLGEGTAGKAWTDSISIEGDPFFQLSPGGIFPTVASPVFGVTTRQIKSLRVRAAALDLAQTERVQFGSENIAAPDLFERLGIAAGSIAVRDYALDVKAPTYWSDKAFDLRDLVGNIRGAVLVEVKPLALVELPESAPQVNPLEAQRAVFRRTDLGPIAFQSLTQSIVKVALLAFAPHRAWP